MHWIPILFIKVILFESLKRIVQVKSEKHSEFMNKLVGWSQKKLHSDYLAHFSSTFSRRHEWCCSLNWLRETLKYCSIWLLSLRHKWIRILVTTLSFKLHYILHKLGNLWYLICIHHINDEFALKRHQVYAAHYPACHSFLNDEEFIWPKDFLVS